MKKTMTYVLAAAAVVIGLVSCSKTKLPETEQEKEQEKPQQGLRTLTVSFAAGTKTTLNPDGLQPVWAKGDKISLDGVVYDVPPEAVGNATCTITTDKQGSIKAVYPADAFESEYPFYKVADRQNGSFGSANICYAQVEPGETTISFENKTAVFEVKVPAHTKELVVTSLGEIDSTTGQRTTVRPINSTGSNDAAKQKITVSVADSDNPTTCYVSVLVDGTNPVLLTNLNFDAVISETTGAQGGVSPSYIKSKREDPLAYKVEVNTIYTPVLHEYVKIGGKKWATRNVGASSSTDNGEYFACGSTDGQTWNGTNWSGMGFDFSSWPSLDGTSSYTLPLKYDAANVNWGGAWRMPTKGDFEALIPFSQSGDAYSFIDSNGNKINFPAAGFGRGTSLETTNSGYWSSSLFEEKENEAYCLEFSDLGVKAAPYSRCYGHPVRPVSD